ncbi:MAG: hypothetical protein NXI30_04710 [bacterium]|nr:hypothetical protein [bacterium]
MSRYTEAFALGLAVAVASAALMIPALDPQSPYRVFSSSLVGTLIGAATGAWIAFSLDHWRRADEERERRESDLKHAQFVLATQQNLIRNILDQSLEEHRDDPHRHVLLKPLGIEPPDVRFDFEALKFVVQSKNPDLLLRLHTCSRCVDAVIGDLQQRHEIHLRLQDENATEPGEILVSESMASQLQDLTDAIYDNADTAELRIRECLADIEEFMRHEYPGAKPLKVEYVKPNADAEVEPSVDRERNA